MADRREQARASFADSGIDRGPIEAALAQSYARAWGRSLWPSGLLGPMRPMPHGFTLSTTAGLVASAPDVARFSIALDQALGDDADVTASPAATLFLNWHVARQSRQSRASAGGV